MELQRRSAEHRPVSRSRRGRHPGVRHRGGVRAGARGVARRVAGARVHRDGVATPDVKVITQGQSADIAGITYTFARNRQYTGLTISRDPGSWVVWVGSALLILGSMLVFFLPYRRVWARVRPHADGTSHVMIAAPLKRDPGFEPVFTDLVHHIADSDAPSDR